MVADWYKRNGYHFLALSDHNVLSVGEKWFDLSGTRGRGGALVKYIERFGDEWVATRVRNGKVEVRLRTFDEVRRLLEEPERFLMIQSEEITAAHDGKPIHVNATNLQEFIPPQSGSSVTDTMQKNVDAVNEQRRRTGLPMFPHINHPNFGWAITAEDLMQLDGEKFFEVYNGHPAVRNYGDGTHAGIERIWDILLTKRLAELHKGVMYGIAVDDAHNYHESHITKANPGRGWVMVRAKRLHAHDIVHAMEDGDFYATSGVTLEDVRFDGHALSIQIRPEKGVTYTTYFIGTRRGYDPTATPVIGENSEPLGVTMRYSEDIGMVLAKVEGVSARYVMRGDEIYVRARVVSSKRKVNPYAEGEMETAWIQPVVGKGLR
ncbi:MAG: hypothetical protein AKCLJLPJ_01440 [Fimbriimonadales bacterium]|nr:hypothetical protein [Fimbriimonadales bacterium]